MSENPSPEEGQPRVAVFEAVNDSLKEAFLGTTAATLPLLSAVFAEKRPRAVSHWATKDRITLNIVEASLSENDAHDFIRHYAASLEAAGWKPLREDS